MGTKHCPPECKADAVVLDGARPGAVVGQVAADPGVSPGTLRDWVRAAGAGRPRGRRAQTPAERPTPLEAGNAALRKKVRGPTEERGILRKGTGYSAGGGARW
ncbi:hypothetical protein SUDANB15_00396 [Streptomyces sp. enrichment culture]|uniref:transposase n=1 Tax=Streptomyces sp. enrichment culture TaxID=1795815 RepID=UPI003F56A230